MFTPLEPNRTDRIFSWIKDNHLIIGSIVIDEIQTALTSREFRPVMKTIKNLMITKIPITFLTATLPIRLESKLKEIIVMPPQHTVIRAGTGRPEHQYFLFRTSKDKLFHHAVAFVVLSSSLLLYEERRGIVFVRSREMGENIHAMFPQLDFIHADIKDDQVRSRMLEKWKAGRSGGWIIGTTSLIQGVDYHDVHLVLFVASPFSMIDFVQGAGRAGRNGKSSRVVVLHAGKPFGPSGGDDLSCKREMVDWLTKSRCRRLGISECMDRESHSCTSLPGAVHCDNCEPDHDLKQLWLDVNKLDPSLFDGNLETRLTTVASTLLPIDPPTQLDVVPLRPQLAPPVVIANSMKELGLQHARVQTALECIELLEAFSPNCGICHAESDGQLETREKHKTHTSCTVTGNHFKSFYDWNKPKVRRLVWIERYLC